MTFPRIIQGALICALAWAGAAEAQQKSAPIGNLRYDLAFDSRESPAGKRLSP